MFRAGVVATGVLLLAPAGIGPSVGATDPLVEHQWHLARIGAPHAWGVTRGAGATIAVIDSGVDAAHEDLAGRIAGEADCVGSAGDPAACGGPAPDGNGHGTHVSGIAVATLGNGVGGAGVAPEASVLAVRALSQVCRQVPNTGEQCVAEGLSGDTAAGIRWAVDHGADVINLSLSEGATVRSSQGTRLADDVEYAWARGAIVVTAAGNDFDALMGSGYGDLPMIVVTATGPDDARAPYANSVGREVRWALAAPGGSGGGACPGPNILSTFWQPTGEHNTYGCKAGTSMATPVVAGAAALLRSLGLSPGQVVDRLLSTADDIGAPGLDPTFGHGLVNVGRAVTAPAPFGETQSGSLDGEDLGRVDTPGSPGGGTQPRAPQVASGGASVDAGVTAPDTAAGDDGAPDPAARGVANANDVDRRPSSDSWGLAAVAATLLAMDLVGLATRRWRRHRARST